MEKLPEMPDWSAPVQIRTKGDRLEVRLMYRQGGISGAYYIDSDSGVAYVAVLEGN